MSLDLEVKATLLSWVHPLGLSEELQEGEGGLIKILVWKGNMANGNFISDFPLFHGSEPFSPGIPLVLLASHNRPFSTP